MPFTHSYSKERRLSQFQSTALIVHTHTRVCWSNVVDRVKCWTCGIIQRAKRLTEGQRVPYMYKTPAGMKNNHAHLCQFPGLEGNVLPWQMSACLTVTFSSSHRTSCLPYSSCDVNKSYLHFVSPFFFFFCLSCLDARSHGGCDEKINENICLW